MHPPQKSDVIVIGGGIIGSSIAYHLSCRGMGVTLLEKGDLAAGSSGACDGLVFLQSKKPGIHLDLAMESRRMFDRLSHALPVPIEYRQTGGMVLIETEAEMAAMETYVASQQAGGLEVSLLPAARIRQLEPCLSKRLLGAAWSPLDGQVNPIALTLGFALGARSLGARIVTGADVLGIETRGGRACAVETGAGRFEADVIVNAAGARARTIGAMAGLSVPIMPRRGQIAVTSPACPMIRHCMISAGYIAAKFDPKIARESGQGISIEQTENGNFLLGSTREFAGFDRSTTLNGLSSITRRTAGVLPALATLNVIRAFAGLRPYTPDGLPILGPVDALPGFIMAAGHEGDGIALSPVTGDLIACMIATGQTGVPLDPFRLERFDNEKTLKEASHER